MRTNVSKFVSAPRTHEGGKAKIINPEQQLRRSVMACLLWESEFYEDGQSIAQRIAETVPLVAPAKVAAMAVEARSKMNLRHVPLLLVREMVRHETHRPFVAATLRDVIQRADELSEFLALYWRDGRCKLAAQVKKGLAAAFPKFNAYSLAKYDRKDAAVKLRDVLFLCHAKPKDTEQAETWKKLIAGTLESPDTWEVALSAGADKKATFKRLIQEDKFGALALLRNLRNMQEAKVERAIIKAALAKADVSRVLPFRFIAAARFAPDLEPDLEACMFRSLTETARLKGRTVIMVDVSGSMDQRLSAKSDMTRMDAACGVAMVAREVCEDVAVATFSDAFAKVPSRRGFSLRDAIVGSQTHNGTYLQQSLMALHQNIPAYDRIIVVTDEQAHDGICDPLGSAKAYVVNVASARNGVGYGRWTHLDGFSEAVSRYIIELENMS